MPSFEDPTTDAGELSEAARGLAHATRQFDDPADSYTVLGELQSTLFSLHQSLQQLARLHRELGDRASADDGDEVAGWIHARVAAGRLDSAAEYVDHATDELMAAFAENGRIAWQPVPSPVGRALDERAASLEHGAGPANHSSPHGLDGAPGR